MGTCSSKSVDCQILLRRLTLRQPIQRVCKYPLLLQDLCKCTPIVDCPDSYLELDKVLNRMRETTREINRATDDQGARDRIQRTWLLQDRLTFPDSAKDTAPLRQLGHALLCGVLFVTYQTKSGVDGQYMLCALFKSCLLLASCDPSSLNYEIKAIIHFGDLKVENTDNSRGLQCHTAPYSWKLVFDSDNRLFEIILSACSADEEDVWKRHILDRTATETLTTDDQIVSRNLFSTLSLDLRPFGHVFGLPGTLARQISIQRAHTIGLRGYITQVIIRSTDAVTDPKSAATPYHSPSINRSQSLLSTNRIAVLAPKRSDRARLERILEDVWTKNALPYPGMSLPKIDNIRTSATSVIRKLSFASLGQHLTKRPGSFTSNASSLSPSERLIDEKPEPSGSPGKMHKYYGSLTNRKSIKSLRPITGNQDHEPSSTPQKSSSITTLKQEPTGSRLKRLKSKRVLQKRDRSRSTIGELPSSPAASSQKEKYAMSGALPEEPKESKESLLLMKSYEEGASPATAERKSGPKQHRRMWSRGISGLVRRLSRDRLRVTNA